MNPTALLRGNVWHELVHYHKERVIVFISGKSVIAVGARCSDVRANELLLVVRGCCVPYVE